MYTNCNQRMPAGERGIALILGLVILVVLALLGASAYSVATQDERIAGNARDHARAVAAAETMLRDCEAHVQSLTPTSFDASGATDPGMYVAPATPATPWVGDQLGTAAAPASVRYLGGQQTMYLSFNPDWKGGAPQCVAELLPPSLSGMGCSLNGGLGGNACTQRVAHITAVGYGTNPSTVVTLVSNLAWYPQ